MKKFNTVLLLVACLFIHSLAFAQDSLKQHVLTLSEAFRLAIDNSVQLKVTAKNVDLAHQQTEVRKLGRLPSMSTGLNYGYISNADIWTPGFEQHILGLSPHHLVSFNVVAGQVIFSGNAVKNSILESQFDEQIAELSQKNNETDTKFLVAQKYLDIYRFITQKQVFANNLKLANARLRNILVLQKQGMVTQNDVLRTGITISDLKLSIEETDNNIAIVNKQLNMLTGRPDSARMIPDSTLLSQSEVDQQLSYFMEAAYRENHDLKIANTQSKKAETDVRLSGSDRLPQLSLFAQTNLDRPYVFSNPPTDIYLNVWEAGIGVKYNISSIYQAPKRIKESKLKLEQSQVAETLQKQQLELAVSSAYIKYNEAKDELVTLTNDLKSAQENYRIVEKKYYNQLALLTDMIDAANTKIEAEIRVTNGQINVIFCYYQLLRSVGTI
ncbi:TolC family protein [Mucilaginibacter sp. X4EP1]|uniref:TolC family protein n=1 Tax=Mucilaginibacter sp. X4EP1 TaxID=2723092 RepID=UPI002167DE4C|nr:TolC family protein [Mucilaginibacter sp. X4EP1]MCS3811986.1 outer membrane protein TolC [Mucilaginibacter sp. X4EP1]